MDCAQQPVVRFFFSSRRRHTRLQGDWSSDVCSSDLQLHAPGGGAFGQLLRRQRSIRDHGDRKSTRLNSSHLVISYAVFCLKKKTSKSARCSRSGSRSPRYYWPSSSSLSGRRSSDLS